MGEFINLLLEFFNSDLAKSYGWLLLIVFIFSAAVIGFLMNLVYTKLIVPAKLIEANNISQEGKKAIKELEKAKSTISQLEEKNKKLEAKLNHFKFAEAIEDAENEELNFFKDKAFDKYK